MSACVATRTTRRGFLIFPPKAVDTSEMWFYCLFLTSLIIMHKLNSQINSKYLRTIEQKLEPTLMKSLLALSIALWMCLLQYLHKFINHHYSESKGKPGWNYGESLRETRMRKLQTALMKHTEWRTVKQWYTENKTACMSSWLSI